jgi:large subunit ribosomal protein L25
MAETIILETKPRKVDGTRGATRLRKEGLVPAVLYGHKEATVYLALPAKELEKAIRSGLHVLDLKAEGKTQKVLIREAQWDHLGTDLLHVDFNRISETERVQVTIPIEVRGTAPGIAAGGVLDQPMHVILVECLAINIPHSIRVNVGELQLEQAIHVKELKFPEGVKPMADPEAIVVQVALKQLEEEIAPAAAAPGEAAEPEVIGRVAKPEEEEGEEAAAAPKKEAKPK